jgi:hypothetical protein
MSKARDWMVGHWQLAWLLLLVWPAMWAADREPPFSVATYIEPAPAKAGQTIVFAMPVHRDVDRGCSTHFSRHMIDSANVRHDYGGYQFMSQESIKAMDKAMGPWLRIAVQVPAGAKPGRAVLVTELEYHCNPMHALWPISVSLYFPFEIQGSE